MQDRTQEQERIPTPEDAANNNLDGLEGAPISRRPKPRSARPTTV